MNAVLLKMPASFFGFPKPPEKVPTKEEIQNVSIPVVEESIKEEATIRLTIAQIQDLINMGYLMGIRKETSQNSQNEASNGK